MHTFDAELFHILVLADLGLRELAVLSEYDVETHPENTDPYEYKGCKEYFHGQLLSDELRAYWLEVVNLLDDACKYSRK